MRLTFIAPSLLLAAGLTACADLELTDPNRQTSAQFWQTSDHALSGMNATYNMLQRVGTYGRWTAFAFDGRSDIAFSDSPWGELASFNKFKLPNYDFPVNYEIFRHHYETIFRANQVIDNVPGISGMDAALRSRVVGEAQFIRALMYSNLANLYGNVPLVIQARVPELPATVAEAQIWAQVEKDLLASRGALPLEYTASADKGRPTRGSANALLGKSYLQQRKWADAAAALGLVVNQTAPAYQLMPRYTDNFTAFNKNNAESVFEVQMGSYLPDNGILGLNIGKFFGPRGPGFADAQPTRWYFNQFNRDSTLTGTPDPRRDATIFHIGSTNPNVFGRTFAQRYGTTPDANSLFFKKWTASDYKNFQDFDEPINYSVIRFADVLLMYAEALNESSASNAAAAAAHVNRVRARVNLRPVVTALTQSQMRDAILHERLLELGLEQARWLDLRRHNMLTTQASIDLLKARDSEFNFFEIGKSHLLPIPNAEINLNPRVTQNPGW